MIGSVVIFYPNSAANDEPFQCSTASASQRLSSDYLNVYALSFLLSPTQHDLFGLVATLENSPHCHLTSSLLVLLYFTTSRNKDPLPEFCDLSVRPRAFLFLRWCCAIKTLRNSVDDGFRVVTMSVITDVFGLISTLMLVSSAPFSILVGPSTRCTAFSTIPFAAGWYFMLFSTCISGLHAASSCLPCPDRSLLVALEHDPQSHGLDATPFLLQTWKNTTSVSVSDTTRTGNSLAETSFSEALFRIQYWHVLSDFLLVLCCLSRPLPLMQWRHQLW